MSRSAIKSTSPRRTTWAETFQSADLAAVRIVARTARSSCGRVCAIAISKLGNGWLYLLIFAVILVRSGLLGLHVICLCSANVVISHFLYPFIKRRYRRLRPFEVDPQLRSLLETLDEHSFPSGHAMTLASVLTPIAIFWPATAMSSMGIVISVAWSQIATAHHYPSDVLAGSALGFCVAYPTTTYIDSFW